MSDSTNVNNIAEQERYIQFSLGEETYAIPLLTVKEVIPPPETTTLPNSPSYYIGIMNLRGQIISIIDLRTRLNINTDIEAKEKSVIIVEIQGIGIGLVVDSIDKVLNLEADSIAQIPDINSQINAKYIQGVFKNEDKLTVFIDIEAILNIKEIKDLKSVA